jgi:hypothetical protein
VVGPRVAPRNTGAGSTFHEMDRHILRTVVIPTLISATVTAALVVIIAALVGA